MLEIAVFVQGPVETNSYLAADPQSGEAVVIDPASDGEEIVRYAERKRWNIGQIWLTHAHFDHIGGAAGVVNNVQPAPPIALHAEDLPLWKQGGGALLFGYKIEPGPQPSILLKHQQNLRVGDINFEVRHVPGHTPGHVLFYAADEALAFCGDLIFAGSVGRTDLPGGDFRQLISSIQSQVFSMSGQTRLLCGHGPETTVGEEKTSNPFLSGVGI